MGDDAFSGMNVLVSRELKLKEEDKMIVASLLSGLALVLWLVLAGYIFYTIAQRSRGRPAKISVTFAVVILVLALLASTLSTSVVVVDAGEVGVVFNVFTGTQDETLKMGLHFVIPYINQVFRYPIREQVYTMTKTHAEGEVQGDDSLWSPTMEGLQVGIDSSTRYRIDPDKADEVHNSFANNYVEILIRPSIRSIVRHYVSQNTVTDVYGPKRAEIQAAITEAMRERFEAEGFELLSFDIRNVNFTPDYEKSIEAKQIAQQDAERMQFVLDKERSEAERKKIEAEGVKQRSIVEAQGEAEALRLINEQIAENPNLLSYRYIEKLAPNVSVMMLPSGGQTPLILDMKALLEQQATGAEQ